MRDIMVRDTIAGMLDLRLIATFREVAARGSFSAAADVLGFTQPAVSQHVSRLERQLGARLLDRDARGATPTRAGEALLRHAYPLLELAERAEADVRAEAGLAVPEVTIASFPSAAATVVPLALRELRAARSDVRPELRILDPNPALDELVRGHVDLALIVSPDDTPPPMRPGFEAEVLFDDPMVVALAAGHPLARRPAVALSDLGDEEWLMTADRGECPDANIVRAACGRAGFEPRVRFESNDYPALLGLAASGMGVIAVPSLAAQNVPAGVVIRPIAGCVPRRHITAAYRANPPAEVTAAIDALRTAGRRLTMTLAAAAA
jgi:DNA-binding transcriptional LysR family regulator